MADDLGLLSPEKKKSASLPNQPIPSSPAPARHIQIGNNVNGIGRQQAVARRPPNDNRQLLRIALPGAAQPAAAQPDPTGINNNPPGIAGPVELALAPPPPPRNVAAAQPAVPQPGLPVRALNLPDPIINDAIARPAEPVIAAPAAPPSPLGVLPRPANDNRNPIGALNAWFRPGFANNNDGGDGVQCNQM